MTTPKNTDKTLDQLLEEIRAWSKDATAVATKAREIEPRIDELEAMLAVGTRRDLSAQAAAATKATIPELEARYRVGDDGPTPELKAAVESLLRRKPRTFEEIARITGARANRIAGVLAKMREAGTIKNAGLPARAIWTMIRSKGAR